MTVSGVKITQCHTADPQLKAVASVFFEEEYVVNGIRVFRTESGKFRIQFPNLPGLHKCGSKKFAFTPFTQKARYTIERAILEKYEEMVEKKERK